MSGPGALRGPAGTASPSAPGGEVVGTIATPTKRPRRHSKPREDDDTPRHPGPPINGSLDRFGGSKGKLVCNGHEVDSEVIYWRIVPGDASFESSISPHHGQHTDRYLTFEYDQGGWNNIRMGMESLLVVAHAMGRTLVVPPPQHLYLLGKVHKDTHDTQEHDEMGFEDFFSIDLLRSHRGFHVLHMEDFLSKEAVTGGLHGALPPKNSSKIWGEPLWQYLNKVADGKPEWMGRYLAFPATSAAYNTSSGVAAADSHAQPQQVDEHGFTPSQIARMHAFGGDRSPVFYEKALRDAHHLHFPARFHHRLLQHHYAFAFFADPAMQQFYRRFVRDFMRYKDNIQCAGSELVALVRRDAKKLSEAAATAAGSGDVGDTSDSGASDPNPTGDYYALHIRRGDFQYKDVKISPKEIVANLHFPNGTAIIPRGALVYISTDDPDGVCKDCHVNRLPCTSYPANEKPPGCPELGWEAFKEAGWQLRFMRDYLSQGYLSDVNPNVHGMIESIVCSRAKVFAGTYYSTFTGYIHRLRGYHGLGEATYYQDKHHVFAPQAKRSVGHGFSREWRAGWTDDGGQLLF